MLKGRERQGRSEGGLLVVLQLFFLLLLLLLFFVFLKLAADIHDVTVIAQSDSYEFARKLASEIEVYHVRCFLPVPGVTSMPSPVYINIIYNICIYCYILIIFFQQTYLQS